MLEVTRAHSRSFHILRYHLPKLHTRKPFVPRVLVIQDYYLLAEQKGEHGVECEASPHRVD